MVSAFNRHPMSAILAVGVTKLAPDETEFNASAYVLFCPPWYRRGCEVCPSWLILPALRTQRLFHLDDGIGRCSAARFKRPSESAAPGTNRRLKIISRTRPANQVGGTHRHE